MLSLRRCGLAGEYGSRVASPEDVSALRIIRANAEVELVFRRLLAGSIDESASLALLDAFSSFRDVLSILKLCSDCFGRSSEGSLALRIMLMVWFITRLSEQPTVALVMSHKMVSTSTKGTWAVQVLIN